MLPGSELVYFLHSCVHLSSDLTFEMRLAFLSGDFAGNAWEVWLVGGERRNKASHDADFVVSNPEG